MQQAATQDSTTPVPARSQVQQQSLAQANQLPQATLGGCNQSHQAFAP